MHSRKIHTLRVNRKGSLLTGLLGLFIASGIAAALAFAQGDPKGISAASEDIETGRKLYEEKCAYCHGFEGRGDGVAAPLQYPRPRDFTRGLYKIRSTFSGELPTDGDLFRVITKGMPESPMPGWDNLGEQERWQLVHYLKTFSRRFARAEKRGRSPRSITVEGKVPYSEESVAEGRQLYKTLECGKCHGQEGRGDGPSAPTLKDDWGFPIRATDLTRSWTFRGGDAREDIHRTFITGLAGTPMPSFAESFEEFVLIDELREKEEDVGLTTEEEEKLAQTINQVQEKTWHLANYVKSFSQKRAETGVVLKSKRIEGEVPDNPKDPRWAEIAPLEFPLVGQLLVEPRLFTPSIEAVTVKSVYNGKEVAFLVIWNDRTQSSPDSAHQAGEHFDDGIAIQFPAQIPEGPERPSFLMGDPRRAVNLWYWKSSAPSTVAEITASGLEAQTVQKPESQETKGGVRYSYGQYKLVMRRPLTTEDEEGDIQFQVGRFIPIAFSAWDGSNGETGAVRSLSSWYYLLLEEPASKKRYIYAPIAALLAVGFQIFLMRSVRRKA